MSNVLCTFSGNNGDILWSFPTLLALHERLGTKVDFCCMGQCEGILPIVQRQSYIDKAFAAHTWTSTNDLHGLQPWYPPRDIERGYDRVFHLTYKVHPMTSPSMTLIDFIADQQGLKLKDPLPFIETDEWKRDAMAPPDVAIGFNKHDEALKQRFMARLRVVAPEVGFFDVTQLPWTEASSFIKAAVGFVGCRSALNVIAHGVKQDNIFIYETHPDRHQDGRMGSVFGCPYHAERTVPLAFTPEQAADEAAAVVRSWIK